MQTNAKSIRMLIKNLLKIYSILLNYSHDHNNHVKRWVFKRIFCALLLIGLYGFPLTLTPINIQYINIGRLVLFHKFCPTLRGAYIGFKLFWKSSNYEENCELEATERHIFLLIYSYLISEMKVILHNSEVICGNQYYGY